MSNPAKNLAAMRKQMANKNLDAYIIPATDPHLSEYLPAHWNALHWASGFSGSAGTLVFTQDFAGLWTDSRYFIQAEEQLAGSGIELVKLKTPHTPEFAGWLAANLPAGSRVGVDGNLLSRAWFSVLIRELGERDISVDARADLIAPVWSDRPALPTDPVYEHPAKYSGRTRNEKLAAIREQLRTKEADFLVFSSLDDIAWTTNLRGTDVPYNPLFVAHMAIGMQEAVLFVDPDKVPEGIRRKLKKDGITLMPYEHTAAYLQRIAPGSRVLLDPGRTSQNLPGALQPGVKVLEGLNPVSLLKACKNQAEADHIRKTMIIDGVVLVRFFFWLSRNVGKERITELTATAKLHNLRQAEPANIGESFGTISAYGPHAALPHYSATADSDVALEPEGLYLLDSGGQYLGGTTDTTRVISLGNISAVQRLDYTLVLKGLIAVCTLRFPKGTKGWQMDALARYPQWQNGINYGHGTGHGVGYFLNVHEGPQSISYAAGPSASTDTPMLPGMVTSVEPGIYRPGMHGVRIENLVLCVPAAQTAFGEFLQFEVLTLAPIFTNLIDPSLLTREEKQWVRDYNRTVYRKLSRYLSVEERAWLKETTRTV